MDRENVTERDDSSILPKVIGTAILAGVAYGGFKLVSDPDEFTEILTKVYNKVMPLHAPDNSEYHKNILASREVALDAAKLKVERDKGRAIIKKAVSKDRQVIFKSDMRDLQFENVAGSSDEIIKSISMWNEIKNIKGEIIGDEIKEALINIAKESGTDIDLNEVKWNGTQATIKYKSPGDARAKELKLNFAAENVQSNSMGIKIGNAHYEAPTFYSLKPNQAKDGIEKIVYSDWNMQVLKSLQDKEALSYLALDNPKIESVIANKLEEAQLLQFKKSKYNVLEPVKGIMDFDILQEAMRSLEGDLLFIQPHNLQEQLKAASYARPDKFAMDKLSQLEEFKGYDFGYMGRYGSKGGENNFQELLSYIKERKQDDIFIQTLSNQQKAADILRPVQGTQHSEMLSRFTNSVLNVSLGTSEAQIAEGTILLGRAPYASTSPSLKTMFGKEFFNPNYAYGDLGYDRKVPGAVDKLKKGVGQSLFKIAEDKTYVNEMLRKTEASGGIYNIFGYVDFGKEVELANGEKVFVESDEIISIQKDLAKTLRTREKVSYKLEGLTEGFTDTVNFVKFDEYGKEIDIFEGTDKKFNIWDVYGNKSLPEEFTKQTDKVYIKINKGAALGLATPTEQIENFNDVINIAGGELEVKRAKSTLYQSLEEYKQSAIISDSNKEKKAFQLYFSGVDNTSKVGVFGTSARSTLHVMDKTPEHIYKDIKELYSKSLYPITRGSSVGAGIKEISASTFGVDLFSKIMPKAIGTVADLQAQKGTPQYLQYMQMIIAGHIEQPYRYGSKQQVILEGDIAKSFAETIHQGDQYLQGGKLNLTQLKKGGNLVFEHAIDDSAKYGRQLESTFKTMASIRKQWVEEGTIKDIVINDTHVSDMGELGKTFDKYYGGRTLETASEDVARRARILPLAAGITPLESEFMSQGSSDFTRLKLNVKDVGLLLDNPQHFQEILARSDVSSQQMLYEKYLSELSIAGPEGQEKIERAAKEYKDFLTKTHAGDDEALKQIEQTFSHISLNDTERAKDVEKFIGAKSLSEIKENTHVFASSFLSEDTNRFGRLLKTSEGGYFWGLSAKALGHGTHIGSKDIITFDTGVNAVFNVLNSARDGGIVDSDIVSKHISQLLNKTSEMEQRASIIVHDAMYARSTVSDKITQSDLAKVLEKKATETNASQWIKDLDVTIGNSVEISSDMFKASIKKTIKDAYTVAKTQGIQVSEQLKKINANAEIFTFHQSEIDALTSVEDDNLNNRLNELVEQMSKRKEKQMEEISKEIKTFTGSNAQPLTEEAAKNLQQKMLDQAYDITALRNPPIYQSSATPQIAFVNKKLDGLEISLGHIALINKAGDFDGDKWSVLLHEMGIKSVDRQRIVTETNVQLHAFMQKLAKNKFNLDDVSAKDWAAGGRFGELSEYILDKSEQISVLGSYLTKKMTPSMNTGALLIKDYLNEGLNTAQGMTSEEIEYVKGFIGSFVSGSTEQQVISSKHLQKMITTAMSSAQENQKTAVESIFDVFDKMNPDDLKTIIKEQKGEIHPMMDWFVAQKMANQGTARQFTDIKEQMDILKNMQYNLRTVKDEQIDRIIGADGILEGFEKDKITQYISKHGDTVPYFESEAFKKLGIREKSYIDILTDIERNLNINERKTTYKEHISEAINSVLKTFKASKLDDINYEDVVHQVVKDRMDIWRHQYEQGILGAQEAANMPKAYRRPYKWDEFKKLISPITDAIKKRPLETIGGGAAVLTAGIAALNLLTGDGTPESPKDVPSYNNPSFGNQNHNINSSYGSISSNSSYNVATYSNTSSNIRMSDSIGSINNIVGLGRHNMVSVRSDGSNPYSSHMSYYN